jgi:hypothetical protein
MKTYIGGNANWADDLIDSSLTSQVTDLVMRGYLMGTDANKPATEAISTPSGKRLLFITGKDSGPLARTTRELYSKAADQKLLVEVEKTRLNRLYDNHSVEYDQRVVAFFQEAIPTTPDKPAPNQRGGEQRARK